MDCNGRELTAHRRGISPDTRRTGLAGNAYALPERRWRREPGTSWRGRDAAELTHTDQSCAHGGAHVTQLGPCPSPHARVRSCRCVWLQVRMTVLPTGKGTRGYPTLLGKG
jgi:hypothetical protein